MGLNMNNGRAIFFQVQDCNTRANLWQNIYPTNIKNDNTSAAMSFFPPDTNKTNNFIN